MKKYLENTFAFFVLFSLTFFLISLYSLIFEVEYNKCDMTYMMQYPDYVPVVLPSSVQRKFPVYNLYVYTEGHSEPVRRGVYEGIPLLFIPGNDGSHKQVRSLASVAIQMRKSLRTEARFDCFAVDLNSEFSALHGPFLYRQSDFVKHVVDHIESLYPSRARFSVILVGHSMGGLVARHVMTLDGFDKGRVPLIVTLAASHQKPVINTDGHMSNFYAEMNSYWRRHQATSLGHVALVSIGGGDRDIEVALDLTRLNGLALPRNSFWASTSHIRDVWASTDHRCIVWCKQLVIALCRALFTVAVDKGFAGDAAATATEFRRRLLPSTPLLSSTTVQQPPKPSALPPQARDPSRWFYRDLSDRRQRSFRFERDHLAGQLFVKILAPTNGSGLLSRGESAIFLLDGSDIAGGKGDPVAGAGWLFACLDSPAEEVAERNAPCKSMARLDTDFGRDLPPSGLHRRLAHIHADRLDGSLRDAAAFVAVLGPAGELTELHFDISPAASRSLRLDARPWSLLLSAAASGADLRLPAGTLYAAAQFSPPAALSSAGRGLEVTLTARKCQALVGAPGSLVQETLTSAGGYTHAVQYFNQNASLALADCGTGDCRLHVVVNPLCEHTLSVRFSPQQLGAALLRESGDCLPTWVGLQVLSALLSSLVYQHKQPSLWISLTSSPIPLLTSAIASLPAAFSGGGLSALGRQLCAACLALPFAAALLLFAASAAAWLNLLMRAPRLLLPLGSFTNFLSPFGCILSLYLTQCHCAAAGIAFLLVTQLLKTAVARLNSKANFKKDIASVTAGDSGSLLAEVEAAEAEARVLLHHSVLAVVCALLTCLCGPSLFVWAKALQQAAGDSTSGGWFGLSGAASVATRLPVADPHYPLGVAFAVLYAVDSSLLASVAGSQFYAPPLALSWPAAICVSLLIGSVASLIHGNYAMQAYLILLLFGTYTLARCVWTQLPLTGRRAPAVGGQRAKLD